MNGENRKKTHKLFAEMSGKSYIQLISKTQSDERVRCRVWMKPVYPFTR